MTVTNKKVSRDGYYQISVVLADGFKFKVPARGYNLHSLLEFEKSLDMVKEHSFKEITKKDYEKMTIGVEEKQSYRKKRI
jgi:hypothetical protein